MATEEVLKDPKRPRPYQSELLQKAVEKDIIVFLGTGTGKTFIATLLIKELGHQIIDSGKVTIFLVPSVSLAEQQHQFLRDNLPFEIGRFTGNDNVDNWTDHEWKTNLKGVQVFVMVHDVFLLAHQRAFLPWGQVNLVIFDECHHASKNHPYARILTDLKEYKKSMRMIGEPVPRVLGLSASIVASHVSEIKFQVKKQELEDLMEAEVATVEDLGKYLEFMTSPDEEFVVFDDVMEAGTFWDKAAFLTDLTLVGQVQSEETSKIEDRIDRGVAELQDTKTIKKIKNLVLSTIQVLDEIGIYGASKVLDTLVEDIIGVKLESVDSTFEESLLRVAEKHVKKFKRLVEEALAKSTLDGLDKIRHFSSPKVNVLLDKMSDFVLNNAKQSDGSSSNISAIVFVKERVCTSILRYVLREAFAHIPHLSTLKVDLAVGGQTSFNFKAMGQEISTNMIRESQKLRQTLAKFAGGQIQVMVSTSVLEEGIDIRQCNFVVRFEPPGNLRQYIQSKGRARAKPSKYLLMTCKSDFAPFAQKINDYRKLERLQIRTCHHIESKPDEPCRSPKIYYANPHEPDTSPKTTEMEAISLVHQYIQKLPCDRFTTLVPFWEAKTETLATMGGARQLLFHGLGMGEDRLETKWYFVLHMPHLSPIRKPITGPRVRDKESAKRRCALKAVEVLHQMGELTDRLIPRDNDDSDDSDDESSGTGPKVGTTKSKKYYKKHSWKAFNSLDMSRGESYLYKMDLQLVEPISEAENDKDYDLYHPENESRKVGVILGQPIPDVGLTRFHLYNYSGKILVQFQLVSRVDLSNAPDRRTQIKHFHSHVCRDTLKMVPPWFDYLDEKNPNFLIVPLLNNVLDELLLNDIFTKDVFDYPDPVVKPLHRDIGHFMVEKVLQNRSPSSPLENNAKETFASYYENTYGCKVTDQSQPLYRVSNADARHDFRLPFPRKQSDKASSRKNTFLLIPELTQVQPIPASLWRELQLLPFALYRVQSFMQVQDLRDTLAVSMSMSDKTAVNLDATFDFSLTRPEFGALICGLQEDVDSESMPSLMELIEPLTFSSCRETFDLERLEILGDAFLKYATSIFIYFKNDQILQEGSLTALRTKVISNKNLFRKAMAMQLAKFVSPQIFEPHRNWNPPGFADMVGVEKLICDWDEEDRLLSPPRSYSLFDAITMEQVSDLAKELRTQGQIEASEKAKVIKMAKEEMAKPKEKAQPNSNGRTLIRPRDYHLIGDKSLADCMEALIGCFLAHQGPKMALRAMLALGIDLSNSDRDFDQWFSPPTNAFHEDLQIIDHDEKILVLVKKAQLSMVEQKIGYQFREKSWLLQALTHCSYNSNNFTDSYERLEFLGDAVLDYLVTCHLVSKYPDKDPGEITILRSSLVCNNTLAKVTVQNQIHKFLLHSSPQIFKKIHDYANYTLNELNELHANDSAKVTLSNLDLLNENTCPVLEDVEIPKVLGDVLEALLGAVYIDSKFDLPLVWNLVKRLFPEMDEVVALKPQSPVKLLMEKYPERVKFCTLPKLGRGLNRTVMGVEIFDRPLTKDKDQRVPPKRKAIFKGLGPNKRMAKETASRCCLREIHLRGLIL
ncbi:hypothetical protein TCAL_10094 [Tigriopus californicus]|uniref:Dicer-2 n=1 Tax=Tigriopus californicus TaxID=6832 RepID=A0A553P9V4_TIGCA|nr:endoribonuclease Dicer-like [Tigriopus californicus]TRY74454.1 hypothetical protein TCAL_10094 [Tigriopus californicus]|eukprot:TCALIF_10094-PA protein Name:"Similar to DCL4 Dicer-like protein 4 (Arabidopsis thaliana)" AED:0.02 eAED:0.02 QI:201/1/1/1/0.87/0.77/9/1525/1582